MKRLIYIANCRLPSERAHGLQIMKMCEAFVEASGTEHLKLTLLAPRRRTHISVDAFTYYGISNANRFEFKKLASMDLFGPLGRGRIAFWLHGLSYAFSVWWYVRANKDAVIFSRDPISSFFLTLLGYNICYEVHDAPGNNFKSKWFFSHVHRVVTTNEFKRQELIRAFGIKEEKIYTAHNGVSFFKKIDEHDYQSIRTHSGQTNLTRGKKNIVYTGSLKSWKGVKTLARATQFLPDGCIVTFVGDLPEEIERFKKWLRDENLSLKKNLFIPQLPPAEMPKFWADADVLVVPNSATEAISLNDTSPIKLFEALGSGCPVVASDIPSIREITGHAVDEKPVAIFANPDDPADWAKKIEQALNLSDDQRKTMTNAAHLLAQRFTWEGRASFILELLNSHDY